MATGFSRTIEAGNEPFYDCILCTCTPCDKEGRNVEAITYCVECCEYMCNGCLKQHNRFGPLRAHRMLEGAAMTDQEQHNQPSFPTKRCDVHNGELVTIFCHTHDAVCCSTCAALDHRPCPDLIYLTKAAKGVKQSREYKDLKVSMKKILTDLGKLRNARQNDKNRLEKDIQNVEASIQDFRKMVYKIIEDLEKATTNHLRDKHKECQGRINADITTLEDVITTVEDNIKQLENTREENESEIFVTMKQIKITLIDGDDVIRDISRGDRIETIQFNLNRKIEEYLKSLNNFGDISESSQPVPHSPMQPTDTSSKQQPGKSRRSSVAKQTTGTSSKQQPDQNRLYSAKQHSQVNVSVNTDRITCIISGVCQLQDGTILIVDCNNDKIKRLDASYAVSDYCDVPGRPYAVCCTSPSEVAVSMLRGLIIQFISVGTKLSLNKSFVVGVACRGVAYTNGELYVSCDGGYGEGPGHVRVYTTAGKLLHTIQNNMSGNAILSCPQNITTSADGSFIYIADSKHGVITLNSSRQVVSTVKCPQLTGVTGICVYNRDQVLVCGYRCNNVIQLGRNGDVMGVILKQSGGITKPRSICYDRSHSKLIVTKDDSDIVKVFDMV